MSARVGPHEIRMASLFAQVRAHLRAARALERAGKRADALLQAARPITHVLPDLGADLRAHGRVLEDLSLALGGVAAVLRQGRGDLDIAVERARDALERGLEAVCGDLDPHDHRLRASAAAAVLERSSDAFRDAVARGDAAGYHEAYGLAREAEHLCAPFEVDLSEFLSAFPSPVPPDQPVDPGSLEAAAATVRSTLGTTYGAVTESWSPTDELRRIDSILASVERAYVSGAEPVAARLAAEGFVRRYASLQGSLSQRVPDIENELSELLAGRIRVAINDREPHATVVSAVRRARELLAEAARVLHGGPPFT